MADRGVAEVISEGKVFDGKVAVLGVSSFPNLGLVVAVMVTVEVVYVVLSLRRGMTSLLTGLSRSLSREL